MRTLSGAHQRALRSTQHGMEDSTHEMAIKILGVEVLDCDSTRAEQNNRIFQLWYKSSQAEQDPHDPSRQLARDSQPAREPRHTPESTPSDDDSDKNPVAGEIYQAYRKDRKRWVASVVLPAGDLSTIGISGAFSETVLACDIPDCYRSQGKRSSAGHAPSGTERRWPLNDPIP